MKFKVRKCKDSAWGITVQMGILTINIWRYQIEIFTERFNRDIEAMEEMLDPLLSNSQREFYSQARERFPPKE